MQMGIFIVVKLKITNFMVKEFIRLKNIDFKAYGKMVRLMVKVHTIATMEQYKREIIIQDLEDMAMEKIITRMERNIKEILWIKRNMVLENTIFWMEIIMKGNGKIISNMERELSILIMALNFKALGFRMKGMAQVY